jgi:trimeric autotransporter adhesin
MQLISKLLQHTAFMRKLSATLLKRTIVLTLLCTFFFKSNSQVTLTTLPNPPYNGTNGLGGPAQITFVIENTNTSGMFLTGVSNWATTANNNSVWELYYTSTALSGPSTDVTTAPWSLVATSQPTTVTATGITPLNFPGLNFFIPGNTQYRFALRNLGPGNVAYSGTGAITPNSFSSGGINLLLGDVQIGGQSVGYSGTGTGLTITPRYFTGEITLTPATACSGIPTGGTAQSSLNNICSPTQVFTLSVTGSTAASGLTYQWQSAPSATGPWTNIAGATNSTLSVTGLSTTTHYRRQIICGAASSFSSSVQVSTISVNYASLPFTESFENVWVDVCNTKDVPNNFWRNTPATGNTSWRRHDDAPSGGNSGAWTLPNNGLYTPVSTDGASSARFHSYEVTGRGQGSLDVYLNCATATPTKRLQFDYINISGTDSVSILVSTNGGASFSRVDSVTLATAWRTKTVIFNSTSATTIVRFLATGDFGVTDIGIDRVSVISLPACTGTPAGGTVVPGSSTVCANLPFTLNVNGSVDPTTVSGISFQWQQSTDGGATWTNIAGATGESYTSPGIIVNTQFRRQTTCSGNTGNSTVANFTLAAVSYATLPYTESFENTWISVCDLRDVPNNFWRSSPVNTDSSWRRNDDGAAANWTAIPNGVYTPSASVGSFSARFHTWPTSSSRRGRMDLFINAATASPAKRLSFDFINTSGTDSLVVFISTNGGASFVRLDSVRNALVWRTKQIVFNSTSATTVIRFQATSDFGVTDIGLDNVNVIDFPDCAGIPTGGTTSSTSTNVCPNTPFTLSVAGATDANLITYQWQQSTDGGTTWTNITGATAAGYSSLGIITSTQFRRQILCGSNSSFSTVITITLNAPTYATLPYAESFENTWIDGCGIRDIPNNSWRNIPVTTDSSWRRNDDWTSAWTNDNGAYTPEASDGLYSARFHTWPTSSSRRGRFDLYLNAATPSPVKRLTFDFINTSGNDSLVVFLSIDGGATFARLDSVRNAAAWRSKAITFTSSSATTVIRFQATSDFGVTDIGLDNVLITDFADCAGVPNAGTTVATPSTVCGDPFRLSLSGASSGSGLTYQWQSGPSATGPWTNIPGATGITHTMTQSGTTWYRAVVLCTISSELANSVPAQVISPAAVNGTFTIDNSITATNAAAGLFKSFNDAYNHIKCGINGPVVFNVVDNIANAAGAYNEQLIMTPVPGASGINTITFRGRGSSIGFITNNTNERAIIKLRGADYIRFDSLIINAGTGTFGYGIQLVANADSNIISNCVINTNNNATTTNYGGIVITGTDANLITATGNALCDYNEFRGNTINGGFVGVSVVASTAGASGFNKFIRNNVRDFYQQGFYLSNSYQTQIDSNTISRPTRTNVTDFTGIFLTGVNSATTISRNTIKEPFGGIPTSTNAFTGINITNADPLVGLENIVSNNLIYGIKNAGAQTGIFNSSSDNAWYIHNTIDLDDVTSTSTATTRGFAQTLVAGGILFFNNMITISRGGSGVKHAVHLNTPTTGFIADNNNYFLNSAGTNNFVGFISVNQPTLANWQAATGQDANSLSRNPFYTSPATGNYMPTNGAVDNKGVPANITVDLLNAPRSTTTPDIGAYEFAAPPCVQPPVPGNTMFDDTTVCQNSFVRLNLTIANWGGTQTFQWQTATSAAGPWTNLSGVRTDPDTTIRATTSLFYRAIVTCGATSATSNALQLIVSPALPAGTYTIGGGATNYVPGNNTGNFANFADAKSAMACGIVGNGHVIFNVVAGSGPFNEQLILDSIPGTSITSTITFNGNGNTIAFGSTNTNERATIKLRGTDYIRFDSLNIDASAGTFGYGVQLIANADSNIFRKCTITTNTTATTTNFAGVVINASEAGPTTTGLTRCDANLFDRNTIIGGNTGIVLAGGTTAATTINDNQFTNNTVRDFYTQGMYIAGTRNTLVQGNTFTRPTRTNTAATAYGIQVLSPISYRLSIDKNRFARMYFGIPANTGTFYGIYHNLMDAPAGNESTITNNLIHSIEGNGPAFGFYNQGSDNVVYYHNTISLDQANSTATGQTAGLYQTTAATAIRFNNNIVTIRRGGSGAKHGIYMAQTALTEIFANNNDYFVTGANAHVGFRTTNQTTLTQWRNASGQDAASDSLNPLYTDTASGNYRPQLLAIDNKGVPVGVTDDIVNAPRSATTPDIGAYEFFAPACTTPPVAGTASVTPNTGICLETPIRLTATGHSPLGSLTFQWQSAPSATGPWTNLGPLQFFPDLDTVATVNTFYRAIVTCNSSSSITNVVQISLNPLLLAGTYTIDPANPPSATNFQTFQAAVNAMLCGVTGPVVFNVAAGTYNERIRIPYIPGTSATNTVTFQSASGVASSVNLTFNADATANYTLRLDSTHNFFFRNMSFTAQNATNGRAVDLFNRASNISFTGNIMNAPAVTTATTTVAGIHATAYTARNITIRNNTVNGGSSGIYLAGGAIRGLVVDSNTVNDAFQYGIFTSFAPNIQLSANTVNLKDTVATSAYGMWVTDCDSAFRVTRNVVTLGNLGVTRTAYGIYINNSDSVRNVFSEFTSNRVTAATNNRATLYGIYFNNSNGVSAVNNVSSIHTTGASSYALYTNTLNGARLWNNSIQSTATSATNNYAAYFANTATANLSIRNNIFSHRGGGRALYVANTAASLISDYNMLYTSGTVLAQRATPAGTFNTLESWKNNSFYDLNSIAFPPAFDNAADLRPDLANPDVWAIHGRGVQIPGNNADFSGNPRPTTLTQGVPDLGAYEFFPTAQPTLLVPTPATPAPNTTQTFMYGTDTVMKITWGPTAPPTAGVRRYSGVVPANLPAGMDSMFFYTKVEVPNNAISGYNAQVYYIDPWQGSIPNQNQLGLGKTTASGAWIVGFSSRVNTAKKFIFQNGLDYVDRFTGLVNPYAPPVLPDKDSSNRGRRFWVAYPENQLNGGQEMVLYLSAQEAANVQVRINGTNWVRNYFVPAGTVRASDFIPKNGPDNAHLYDSIGKSVRGISIVSDVPIVAYAHYIGSTSSGAAMLLPVGVWGYEYKTLGITQDYGANSFAYYTIISDNDSTMIDITSAAGVPLQNAGITPGTPFRVMLNKGEVYQVLASSQTQELSGSVIKSVPNASGKCFPIATFSGSTRTALSIGCGSGGDFMMQQNFPATAWGTKYLTAPTSSSVAAANLQTNVFRIAVRDPSTVVRRNGTILTGLVNNHYYEYQSNTADYITADKEIMVAQFLTGACEGVGDPEMIYISPVEQGINNVGFYRNTLQSITTNYLTMVIPTGGLSSLVMRDGATIITPDFTYPHPQNALTGRNYTVVVKRWTSAQQQVTVTSDSSFTGITYGLGSVESYGYNAGTLVKTLRALGSISNTLSPTGGNADFTCAKAPFTFAAYLPLRPDSIRFQFSTVPGLTPNADVVMIAPVPNDSVFINGVKHYVFRVAQTYTFNTPGLYSVPVIYGHPSIEACNKTAQDVINVQVVPSPAADFTINYSGCVNDVAQFTGVGTTSNGVTVNAWQWTFNNNTTATGQNTSFTYATPGTYTEKLRVITADGCVGDTTKQITVNARPVVNVVQDSLAVCAGTNVTYTVQNPDANTTYTWYTTATGGTPVFTGTAYTFPATVSTDLYIEGVNAANCASTTRKRVRLVILSPLTAPVVSVQSSNATSVTFTWPAVPGAAGYEVSTNGGTTWTAVATNTYTVIGLSTLQSVTLTVRAVGTNACQNSGNASASGCATSAAAVTNANQQVCPNSTATFTIQSPGTGITYNWYNAATGGTIVGTGTSFTTPAITATTSYWVEQTNGTCTGARTQVTVTVLQPLANPVVTVVGQEINSVTFGWNAVPNAAAYQVSVAGGPFVTPSSGATGLTHTVTGLRPLDTVSVVVRAIGVITCQTGTSASVTGRSRPDDIFIPNAFTPNGDGLNDKLLVYGYTMKEMNFMIFNQFGEKIYQNTNLNDGWDGNYQGKPQPSGVYLYVVRFVLKDGKVVERKGSINLIR